MRQRAYAPHAARHTAAMVRSAAFPETRLPHMPDRVSITLTVNGLRHTISVEPRRTLLDALRDDLQLTGAKPGCNLGQCGACTVLLDGEAVYSCLALAVECEGSAITTIEGLGDGAELDPVQAAFVAHDALQCGYCTPGQVLAMKALLARHPHPSDDEILRGMSGNLCRCGAYPKILAAGRALAKGE
jgi:aerobic-type carbon monoxide dehydrogenase small subunit (CoxS/CutS family)